MNLLGELPRRLGSSNPHNLLPILEPRVEVTGENQEATQLRRGNRTVGYHRVDILAALANTLWLVAIAVVIGWEAVERL